MSCRNRMTRLFFLDFARAILRDFDSSRGMSDVGAVDVSVDVVAASVLALLSLEIKLFPTVGAVGVIGEWFAELVVVAAGVESC